MHPQRWGDPAAAADLPDSARGLIEMAFGLDETPALDAVTVPASALSDELLDSLRGVLGAEHVLTDDETRRLRTRGKSTPDLLRARAGDLSDAPDAVVRPALARRRRRGARLGCRAPRRGGALRWRHLRDRRPGRASRRLRRAGLARPGPDEAAGLRRPRVDDGGARAGAARPRGRGAARRRGRAARPLPAVLRVRHDRRLRGHPVLRPVQRRLRPLRRPRRRPARRDAARRACGSAPPRRTPPARTCASCSSARRAPSA